MKPYHHGDLKNKLIEAGIEYINKNGYANFSLRKIAALCSVSHAAPYNHFADKEDLLYAMREYVAEKLTEELKAALRNLKEPLEAMIHLGITYVTFFVTNPKYFQFIFSHENQISIKESETAILQSNFIPFEFFRDTAVEHMKSLYIEDSMFKDNILTMWAIVQGLTYLFALQAFEYNGNINDFIERMLKEKINLISISKGDIYENV